MREMRFFKQLEFLFEGGTRSRFRVGEILAASAPNLTSSSERPIHPRGRDVALESQARELLRTVSADKLAHEIRVEWNPRLKTCAGRADYRGRRISLNPLLFDLGDQLASKEHAIKNLECNMHSRFINPACGERVPSKPECKMHSSLARDVVGVSRDRAPRRGIVCDEVDRTLRHELAHLLAQWRAGRCRIAPHGEEWRQACRDLGIADEARCHNLPFATKTYAPRYVYRCPNCKEEFPRVRKIRRAIACLVCCRAYNRGNFDSRFRLRLVKRTDPSS